MTVLDGSNMVKSFAIEFGLRGVGEVGGPDASAQAAGDKPFRIGGSVRSAADKPVARFG